MGIKTEITLYTEGTPNGLKASITLEELGLEYKVAGLGPMQGHANHFTRYAPDKMEYPIDRYVSESHRLYRTLDHQLAKNKTGYIVGDKLAVADIAVWPWVAAHNFSGLPYISKYTHIAKWFNNLLKRPGFEAGRNVPRPHFHITLNDFPEEELDKFAVPGIKWQKEAREKEAASQETAGDAQDQVNLPIGLEALEPSFKISEFLQRKRFNASPSSNSKSPLDFQSPFSWSLKKKITILSGAFMASTLASYSAGAYALASEPLRNKWNIDDTQFNAGITLFVTGFAITPMVLAPVSEVHGRYWVFVGSGIVFLLGTLGCAVTDSYAGMMVARLITGNGAAVFATLTGGVVSDLYRKADRNTPMALYSLSIMIGTGLVFRAECQAVQNTEWHNRAFFSFS
ncbi:hypothetical protein ACLX1H_000230 [Fusarium chlamydosporum]